MNRDAFMTPVGSNHRPLRIRRRNDLECLPQSWRGEAVWAVKDPVALRYFHLREEAWWLLGQLDGATGFGRIQDAYARRFAPSRLSLEQLRAMVARFHNDGLVVAETARQGDELLRRARKLRSRQRRDRWTSPLAIRFRGLDPNAFLNRLYPLVRWLFSWWFLSFGALVAVSAMLLVAVRFDTLLARLPERAIFLSPANIFWLAVTLAGVKIVHELGHALACKHFGRECRELGLMLLVFTPCLYCNVSDAWMLSSKWQRAAVGAAGIFVEVLLASVCTFLWWFSQPGLFNALCLNTMCVCSVSTLLLNGNPLLRYDGYYVLSDLVETPNLAQASAQAVREMFERWYLGIAPASDDLGRDSLVRRMGLAAYATASLAYRVVVVFGVLWFLHRATEPYRVEVFAQAIAMLVVAGWVAAPLKRLGSRIGQTDWSEKMRPRRASLSLAILLALAVAAIAIPLPFSVRAPVVLQAANARRVYAQVEGRLAEARRVGDNVAPGDTIARLTNSDLELELTRLAGERDRQLLRVENLKRRQGSEPQAAAQIPPAEALLADLEQRLRRRQLDAERLSLRAPVAGTILPPRLRPATTGRGELAAWTGTPLDPKNLGCHLEVGTMVCLVGDPRRLEALVIVDQADVEFVAPGQTVQILLDQSPGAPVPGTIIELAEIDLDQTPPELLPQGEIPTRRDPQGALRPVTTFYQARVALEPSSLPAISGEAGRARIAATPLSLGTRLWRTVRRTFGIELTMRSG